MVTTTDYLNELINQKTALATAISNKGIAVSASEKFNTLVPKVAQIDTLKGEEVVLNNFTEAIDQPKNIVRLEYPFDSHTSDQKVNVKLSSDTITDFSTVTLTRCGKNIFDPSNWTTAQTFGGITIQYLPDEDCFLFNGSSPSENQQFTTYTPIFYYGLNNNFTVDIEYVSGTTVSNRYGQYAVFHTGYTNDAALWGDKLHNAPLKNESTSQTKTCDRSYFLERTWIYVYTGVTFDNYKVKIQVTYSDSSSSYSKFGYSNFTVPSSGEISDISVVFPYTTLLTNKPVQFSSVTGDFYKGIEPSSGKNAITKVWQPSGTVSAAPLSPTEIKKASFSAGSYTSLTDLNASIPWITVSIDKTTYVEKGSDAVTYTSGSSVVELTDLFTNTSKSGFKSPLTSTSQTLYLKYTSTYGTYGSCLGVTVGDNYVVSFDSTMYSNSNPVEFWFVIVNDATLHWRMRYTSSASSEFSNRLEETQGKITLPSSSAITGLWSYWESAIDPAECKNGIVVSDEVPPYKVKITDGSNSTFYNFNNDGKIIISSPYSSPTVYIADKDTGDIIYSGVPYSVYYLSN